MSVRLLLTSLVALLVFAPSATSAGPPDTYSAAEIRGWVVDAETKQPLEGVYVVAQWILQTGLFDSRTVTRLHIMEAVTDAKGEYYFPPWGPKPRPFLSSLSMADPRLTFFKPGYKLLDRSNAAPHDNALRTSRWNEKTVALEPFRGTLEEWIQLLRFLQIGLGWSRPTDDVPPRMNDHWRFFPRIVLAVLEQRRLLPEHERHRVLDPESWGTSEDELRALSGKGRTS